MENITLVESPIRVDPNGNGSLSIRLLLIDSEDGMGGIVRNHRFIIEPFEDIDGQVDYQVAVVVAGIADLNVDRGTKMMQYPPIDPRAVVAIKAAAKEAWTPDALKWWSDLRAAQKAEYEADQARQAAEKEAADKDTAKFTAAAAAARKAEIAEVVAAAIAALTP